MRSRSTALFSLAFVLLLVGAAWVFASSGFTAAKKSCCYDGSPCCFPGSPCCETDDCCYAGSPCCFAGSPCCVQNACCAQKLSCCDGSDCCANEKKATSSPRKACCAGH